MAAEASVDARRKLAYAILVAKRYFSLDAANALVPQVADIMCTLLQLHWHLRAAVEALDDLQMPISRAALAGEEEVEGEPEAMRLYAHARGFYETIRECVDAIRDLGAEVKDVESGLVDFHSLLDGDTEVVLSWRVGDSAIRYFHLPEADVGERHPVAGHDFLSEPRPSAV